MGHSPPGSSVHGISQPAILECVAIFSSRGFSWQRHQVHISCIPCIADRFFAHWAIREAQKQTNKQKKKTHNSLPHYIGRGRDDEDGMRQLSPCCNYWASTPQLEKPACHNKDLAQPPPHTHIQPKCQIYRFEWSWFEYFKELDSRHPFHALEI